MSNIPLVVWVVWSAVMVTLLVQAVIQRRKPQKSKLDRRCDNHVNTSD